MCQKCAGTGVAEGRASSMKEAAGSYETLRVAAAVKAVAWYSSCTALCIRVNKKELGLFVAGC